MIEEAKASCENLREVIFLDEDWENFLNKATGYKYRTVGSHRK
jgi:hypothetical protein